VASDYGLVYFSNVGRAVHGGWGKLDFGALHLRQKTQSACDGGGQEGTLPIV
jgi:hypothetical protein